MSQENQMCKKRHTMIVCIVLAFSYMLLVFAPMELFLQNASEFSFDLCEFFQLIVKVFVIVFLSFWGFFFVVCRIFEIFFSRLFWIYDLAMCLFVGLFMALYIQGNFVPRNYGKLDGRTINFAQYKAAAITSSFVWGTTLGIVFVTWLVLRNKKIMLYNIVIKFSLFVFSVLTLTIFVLLVNNKVAWKNETLIITGENLNVLSTEHNIIILLLDMFDAGYMDELIKENEDYISGVLEDFTYYSNTAGGYGYTKSSIPYLLTGKKTYAAEYFSDEEYETYLNEAFEDAKLFSIMQENDYDVGVYTYPQYLTNKEGIFDNIIKGRYQIFHKDYFMKSLYKIVAFEYLPHQLKKYCRVDIRAFDECLKSPYEDVDIYSFANQDFYEGLKTGITVGEYGNTFRFIHLDGMHWPYMNTAEVYGDGREHSYKETLLANMKIIEVYLDALKTAGVYENSEIFIMADHGATLVSGGVRPLFLHKSTAEHHEFIVDNMSMSYDDFYETLLCSIMSGDNYKAMWNTDKIHERIYCCDGILYVVEGDLSTNDYRLLQKAVN